MQIQLRKLESQKSKTNFNNTSSGTDKSLTDNIIKDVEELRVEFSSLVEMCLEKQTVVFALTTTDVKLSKPKEDSSAVRFQCEECDFSSLAKKTLNFHGEKMHNHSGKKDNTRYKHQKRCIKV